MARCLRRRARLGYRIHRSAVKGGHDVRSRSWRHDGIPVKTIARRAGSLLWVAVLLLGSLVTATQNQPDFSGEWILNLERSTLHPDYTGLQSGTTRIEHNEPQFAFGRTFVIDGQPWDASYDITTDGTEKRTEEPGATIVSTMRWHGNALILSNLISLLEGGSATNTVRYELLEGGGVLRATEDFIGPPTTHHNIWVFERR